jgi:chemotaxis protein CheD
MELLINRVLVAGTGRKTNLEFKLFGGSAVSAALGDVGARNVAFVRNFLADEGYAVFGEDLGGTCARRVLFKPGSGRVLVKRLDGSRSLAVAREEAMAARRQPAAVTSGPAVELF